MEDWTTPAQEVSAYPKEFEAFCAEEDASAFLAEWIHEAYQLVNRKLIPSEGWESADALPPPLFRGLGLSGLFPPQISERSDSGCSRMLHRWVFLASRDEAVQRTYGRSEKLFDRTYLALEREAFDFVNDLLRRTTPHDMYEVDKQWVKAEAAELWKELGSGVETYEFGVSLPFLVIETDTDTLPIGPDMVLHRIEGGWAAKRFDQSQDIPPSRWAVAITHKRKRRRSQHMSDWSTKAEDEEIETTLKQRALLPVRLVLPKDRLVTYPGSGYRVGISGYRQPDEREFFYDLVWREWGSEFKQPSRTTQDIARIGAILQREAKSQDILLEQDAAGVLELALRAFASAYNRRQWRDKIVDLAETMEALLGDGGEGLAYMLISSQN